MAPGKSAYRTSSLQYPTWTVSVNQAVTRNLVAVLGVATSDFPSDLPNQRLCSDARGFGYSSANCL